MKMNLSPMAKRAHAVVGVDPLEVDGGARVEQPRVARVELDGSAEIRERLPVVSDDQLRPLYLGGKVICAPPCIFP
jgi:hypothetical protein